MHVLLVCVLVHVHTCLLKSMQKELVMHACCACLLTLIQKSTQHLHVVLVHVHTRLLKSVQESINTCTFARMCATSIPTNFSFFYSISDILTPVIHSCLYKKKFMQILVSSRRATVTYIRSRKMMP